MTFDPVAPDVPDQTEEVDGEGERLAGATDDGPERTLTYARGETGDPHVDLGDDVDGPQGRRNLTVVASGARDMDGDAIAIERSHQVGVNLGVGTERDLGLDEEHPDVWAHSPSSTALHRPERRP